jgi:hypothetical protein
LSDAQPAPLLPGAWRPVLETLSRLRERWAAAKTASTPVSEAESQALEALHDELLRHSAALVEPESLTSLTNRESERLFARAVLLLLRLERAVVGNGTIVDTAGSRTLEHYAADFYGDEAGARAVRARLAERFGLDEATLSELDREAERSLTQAERRGAIARSLAAAYQIRVGAPRLRSSVRALFEALYPASGLADDEVELVFTETMLFFCIPFKGSDLTSVRYAVLSEAARRPIQAFLTRVTKFKQEFFAHFPVFGFFDGKSLPKPVLDRLVKDTGFPPELVVRELASMVTILPLDEVDKYIVHDVWGHGWQASVMTFEHMYAEIAGYARPLSLAELQGSFTGRGADLALDEAAFTRGVHALLAERLPVAMTPVFAEMLADVVEFKFLDTNPALSEAMPSSSFFKFMPTKLDLMLQDIPFYFGQATKAFRLLASDPKRQAALAGELVREGGEARAAARAVADAVRVWQDLERDVYAAELRWTDESGKLRVNRYTCLALGFVSLHRVIVELYHELAPGRADGLPIRSWRDLIVLAAAVFFEQDRRHNLWRLDEFLSLRFKEHCLRFAASTLSASASASA